MGCTLYCQTIYFFAKFENVAFVLAETTLHTTHTKIQSTQSAGSFGTSELSLLFHSAYLLKSFLLLLPDVVFQSGFCVSNIALQVAPHYGDLVETITQRVLRRVQTLLGCCQILVGKVNATIQRIDSLVSVTGDLGF